MDHGIPTPLHSMITALVNSVTSVPACCLSSSMSGLGTSLVGYFANAVAGSAPLAMAFINSSLSLHTSWATSVGTGISSPIQVGTAFRIWFSGSRTTSPPSRGLCRLFSRACPPVLSVCLAPWFPRIPRLARLLPCS